MRPAVRALTRCGASLVFALLVPTTATALSFNKGVPILQQGPGECGPTSAASSLLFWDTHGFPNVVPPGLENPEILIADLATRMGTGACGTADQDFLNGLHSYLEEFGGNQFRITLYDSGSFMDPAGLELVAQELEGEIGFDEYFRELVTNREDVLIALPGHWVVGNSLDDTLQDNGTPADPSDDFFNIDLMDPERGNTGQYFDTRMRAGAGGDILYGFPGAPLTFQNIDVLIAISPVPEPGIVGFVAVMAGGFTVIAAWRRRRT